jgi:replication factor A2
MFGSSQGLSFGAGGYAVSSTQDVSSTPEKKVSREDKQTCMPLTVRILSDAVANRNDDGSNLQVHGVELANFVLVGVVENLMPQATGLEFVLNDASGRIKVRYYQSGDDDAGVKDLAAGRYASIVGNVRTTPMLHVSALSLRPVGSADEVSYHMIEVAHAALKLKCGGSSANDAVLTPAKQMKPVATADGPITPTKESQDVVMPASSAPASQMTATSEPLKGSALREAVVAVFRKEGEDKPEGISVDTIISQLKGTPSGSIRSVLEEMVNDGEVFSTIDDEHFSLI